MKLCWDNIECLRHSKRTGLLRRPGTTLYWHFKDSCGYCGEEFLGRYADSKYCDARCAYQENENLMNQKGEKHPCFGRQYTEEEKRRAIVPLRKYMENNDHPMLGVHHTEDAKLKIAEKAIGNKRWLGKKHTKETKRKISEFRKANPHPESVRKKQAITITGSGNPNWKGGQSKLPYCPTWTDTFKKDIKDRDGWECQNPLCETPNEILCVHHINYKKMDCDFENLITLCNICNSKANTDRKWHEAYYRAIMDKNKQLRMIDHRRANYV